MTPQEIRKKHGVEIDYNSPSENSATEKPISNETDLSILKKILDRQDSQNYLLEQQLRHLRGIRWAIVGFAIWFIIQAWIIPSILASSH